MDRDQLKSASYFEKYIGCQNKRIDKFLSVAAGLESGQEEKKLKCLRIVANFKSDLIYAKYSIGAESTELSALFIEYIELLKRTKVSSYAEYVDALSMAILFEVKMDKLADIVEDDRFDDDLVRYLQEGIVAHNAEANLLYEDFYKPFYDYIMDICDLEQFAAYMEQSWYESCRDFAWYDSDKSAEDIYVGYWCWLAAAIMKIKGSKALHSIKYVPMDLVKGQ